MHVLNVYCIIHTWKMHYILCIHSLEWLIYMSLRQNVNYDSPLSLYFTKSTYSIKCIIYDVRVRVTSILLTKHELLKVDSLLSNIVKLKRKKDWLSNLWNEKKSSRDKGTCLYKPYTTFQMAINIFIWHLLHIGCFEF